MYWHPASWQLIQPRETYCQLTLAQYPAPEFHYKYLRNYSVTQQPDFLREVGALPDRHHISSAFRLEYVPHTAVGRLLILPWYETG